MKKIISAGLALLMLLFTLNACSNTDNASPHLDLPFVAQVCTLSMKENVEQNYQNEFFFFQNEKDLKKGAETLSKNFYLEEKIGSTSAEDCFAAYDDAFFETHTLLLFKRLHSTDAILDLTRSDVQDGACTVRANLTSGQVPVSLFRLYFVTLDKADFFRNDLEFSLDIQEIEPEEDQIYQTKLVMALGNQYKVVEDDSFAKELQNSILEHDLIPTSKDPDAFADDVSDIALVGPGFYARITKNYIDVFGEIYAPDEALSSQLLKTYVALESEEKTLSMPQEETN